MPQDDAHTNDPAPSSPPTAGPPPADPPPAGAATEDERTWAMAAHLLGLAGYLPVVPGIGAIIGPLVVWLIYREKMPFVDDQGREAVNFQISVLIYAIIAGLLIFVFIGMILLPAVILFQIVMVIIAAIQSKSGEAYRYPFCIRLIK